MIQSERVNGTQINEKGIMYLMADNPHWWVLPYCAVAAVSLLAALPFFIYFFRNRSVIGLIGILILAVFGFFNQFFIFTAKSGKRCEYEADEEKFIIRRPWKPEECFYYTATLSVEVQSFSMAFMNCGYKVTILTRYKTAVFYYAFNGEFSRTAPDETPFSLLGQRIHREKIIANNDLISGEDYYENAKEKEP